MKQILVTGGAGYIGSHTVIELVNNGYQPIILDNFSNATRALLPNLFELCGKKLPVIEADCTDSAQLRKVFVDFKIDGVIHFAAFKAVGESVADPLKYYKNNLIGLMSLLEVMTAFQVRKLVFSSSCTVYGIPNDNSKVFENSPLGTPNSPYGWTKYMSEQILKDVCVNNQIEAVLLRYFNPIGAHVSGKIGELPVGIPNNVVPYMTQTAAGIREELTVFGSDYPTEDGTCVRDYIHVSDLALAHIAALDVNSTTNPEIFNVGTGKGTSVLELIKAFTQATGKELNWKFGNRRPGDVAEIYADITKTTQFLKWKAKHDVNQAIADAWRWEQYRLQHEIN